MGLTIHYSLRSNARTAGEARHVVEQLRERALDLPFTEVGKLLELRGGDCDFENARRSPRLHWLLIQASQYVEQDGLSLPVAPIHVIGFSTSPGEGSEAANFGLCRYPSMVEVKGSRFETGLKGWSWRSFCKTQYASNPECGGVENFLRSHLTVVSLLDHAAKLGILKKVSDESGFWQGRNVEDLTKEVGEWNHMVAAFVGRFKDALGKDFVAEITNFPNFEHLEAEGRAGRRTEAGPGARNPE
jgi:hypothetical protein